MEVGLLGPLRVTEHGDEVPVRGPKQRALLAVLAIHGRDVVPADRLIDLLWEEEQPSNPANALQAQVSNLRRALGPDVVAMKGNGYTLNVDFEASEAATFERLAAEGRAALESADPARAVELLRAALDVWRGDALSDFAYESWARPEITRLDELRAATIDARIDAELALGKAADLVGEIEALLAEDRLREHRWAQLMLALYRSGRQADALRAFNEARTTLVDELGVDPGPELVELEAQILNHDAAIAPQRAPAAAALTLRLPATLTRFVGRARELEHIERLAGDGTTRLITLVGPGGAGKTRLALEAATRLAATAPDGAALVELDAVTDSEGVAVAVARAVGVRADGPTGPASSGSDVIDAVSTLLRDRRVLLVVDNCEHLVVEAARVVERLLNRCRGLLVIATSREALTLTGEHLLPVGPLATDDAVVLFVDRATAARPAHADVPVDVVASICERLDGMPLAVELAAARTKALPVAQIAERLDKRFRLLTGGARTAVPRQQTLRAVVDWSYDLLFDDEKQVFARLATFVGGWTLDAAEAVCVGDMVTDDDVLDHVTALIDKSLVIADIDEAGDVRYRMLQTIAEYARERLADASDVDHVRSRHASFFADLAHHGEEGLTSIDGSMWRAVLNRDVENLRTAFDWLCETNDPRGLAMANDLALLWWARGDWAEGVRWADQALTLASAARDIDPVGVALQRTWRGLYATTIGDDPVEAASIVAQAIEAIEAADDEAALLRALVVFATMLSRHRDPGVHAVANAAVELAKRQGERWYEGAGYALLAIYHVRLGHLSDAKDAAERAADALASVRDTMTIFETHLVLATIAQLEGRLDDASAVLDEMESSARAAGIRHYEEWALARRGLVRLQAGDVEAAALALGQAVDLAADPWADAYAHLGSAMLSRRLADAEAAATHLDRALDIQSRIGGDLERGYLHVLRGWLALDRADHNAAREHAEVAMATAHGAATVESMATEVLAAAAALDGGAGDAQQLLDRARSLAPMIGHPAWFLTRGDVARVREGSGSDEHLT